MSFNYKQYQKELVAVLRTEDKLRILAFFKKHGIPTPSSDLSFWGAVHKMRLSLPAFTEEEREVSREWLRSNGMMARPTVPHNLQKYLTVFGDTYQEAIVNGLTDEEATREANEEANRLHPLSEEDKAAITRARMGWAAINSAAAANN